jgi:hypothetical protein
VEAQPCEIEEGKMTRYSILTSVVAGLIGLYSANAAKSDETLKFKYYGHVVSSQTQDIDDVEGHAVGLVKWSGIVESPDGSFGTGHWETIYDFVKGAGSYTTYVNLTLKDGSVLLYKVAGTSKPENAAARTAAGPITVTGGKGRFAGAKGDGTVTGTSIGQVGSPNVQGYGELVINIKK